MQNEVEWKAEIGFPELTGLIKSAYFRHAEAVIASLPESLLLETIEIIATGNCDHAREGTEFLKWAVRAKLQSGDTRAAMAHKTIVEHTIDCRPDRAWEAGTELLFLFGDPMFGRMNDKQIDHELMNQNPLAAIELCYYDVELPPSDCLVGAYLHTAHRVIFHQKVNSAVAPIFAAIRESYGYIRAGESSAAVASAHWAERRAREVERQLTPIERNIIGEAFRGIGATAADAGTLDHSELYLKAALEWGSADGNVCAESWQCLGDNYKQQKRFADALRAYTAGTQVKNVTDKEITTLLHMSLGELRSELEGSVQPHRLSPDGLDSVQSVGHDAASALLVILSKKEAGEQISDDDLALALAQFYAWNQTFGAPIKAETRLSNLLLMVGVALSIVDRHRAVPSVDVLFNEACKLEAVANDMQRIQLAELHKVMQMLG